MRVTPTEVCAQNGTAHVIGAFAIRARSLGISGGWVMERRQLASSRATPTRAPRRPA